MKIAVLMSTYNGAHFIQEQIESILLQQGEFQLDLWVRDDGSTDQTTKMLQIYKEQGKLNWYSGENLGPAKSFMDLIQHCQGYDFYAFSDQDDYWFPDKLQIAVNSIVERKGMWIYFSDAELVDYRLEPLGRNVYTSYPKTDLKTLSCAGGILGCTMLFNSALAKVIQEKRIPEHIVMHDFYMAEVCLSLGGNIIFDPRVGMKYRQHENNTIGVPHGKKAVIRNRIFEITKKKEVGIDKQAAEILALYQDMIDEQTASWLYRVATYKLSINKRFLLAISRETQYVNKNMALSIRLSLLLGNR